MGKIKTDKKIWFITGSQHLYGEKTLEQVAANAQTMVRHLNECGNISLNIEWKPTVKTPDEATAVMQSANTDTNCIGVIAWMHTFSPAKMWINGLKRLQKPLLHLHTQFNQDIPWNTIDMDFMNLNQAAHGDREFGFICTRLKMTRKVVTGYWKDSAVQRQIDTWARAALAWDDSQTMKVARIGDNMREVAVTEGNKVSAQIQFGYSVNGYGVADVVKYVNEVSDAEVESLVKCYADLYTIPDRSDAAMSSIRDAARQETGIRNFLKDSGFAGFTTTFEDLAGLSQLPGLASQRLMAEGYGFGAEGDWKTAALLRTMKVMGMGLGGGTSFMEDYTYHLENGRERVLGAHMLEVCPTIAGKKPTLEVHPLGIGGKAPPARLVFTAAPGSAVNACMIELDAGFRLIVNEVQTVEPDHALPKLPTARAMWIPKPDFHTATRRWIEAGGSHHSVYSSALTPEHMADFAAMAGMETVMI